MSPRRVPAVVLLSLAMSASAWQQAASQGLPGRAGGSATPGRAQQPPARDRQQPSATGAGTLGGRVTSIDGAPVRRAQVLLTGTDTPVRKTATTDSEGRYTFTDLPAGSYTIRANKGGYVSFAYGQQGLNDAIPPVILGDGESLPGLNIVLPRGSAITGRVTDEFGDPILQAQVQALRYQFQPDGQRRLVQGGPQAMTDDLGQFRLFGLTPGEYVVSATTVRGGLLIADTPQQVTHVDNPEEGYAPTYYPGTGNPGEAQPLSVGLGQEVTIQLQLVPSRLARISGIVVDSQGRSVGQGTAVMIRSTANAGVAGIRQGIVNGDGAFTITAVPPGDYTLEVRPRQVAGPRQANDQAALANGEFAAVPLSVGGGDVTGLRIVTGKGATLSGRVVFEGTPPPSGTCIRVVAQPVGSGMQVQFGSATEDNGVVGTGGSFRLEGIAAPIFLRITIDNVRGGAPPAQLPYMTKSVLVDGVDVADVPFDPTRRGAISGVTLVVTDKLTDISGVVTDGRGTPLDSTTVLIVPDSLPAGVSPTRFVRIVQANGNGKFSLRGIPAGRYAAVALSRFDQAHQFNPDVIQRARQLGKSFSVNEGESITVDLRLTNDF